MLEKLEPTKQKFFSALDLHIGHLARQFLESSCSMGIANCYALAGYGKCYSPIHRTFQQARPTNDKVPASSLEVIETEIAENATQDLAEALKFVNGTHDIILRCFGDDSILPYFHVTLVLKR